MNLLFELDYKNYNENGSIFKRPSARAIIIRDSKIAMVYSKKYNYYKYPGGGIKNNEDKVDALIREVKEEVGLEVIKESIKEFGYVLRKERGTIEDIFIQENYYYLCDVGSNIYHQSLDDYEKEEEFTLRWVTPKKILETNINGNHFDVDSFTKNIIERDSLVTKLLKEKMAL